jgi:hypothetical protein
LNQYIKGKRIINTTLLIIGQIDHNRIITFKFVSEFNEHKRVLNRQQISRFELDYFFDPTEIVIEPSGYFKLSDKDKRIQSIIDPVSVTFEPLTKNFVNPFVSFDIHFTLIQGKKSVKTSALINLPLPTMPELEPEPDTVPEIDPDKEKTGEEHTKKAPATRPIPVKPVYAQPTDVKKSDTKTSEDITNELVAIVNEIKPLYSIVHNLKVNMETAPIDQAVLNQYKFKAEQLKITFDTKFMMGDFSDPEAVNRIFMIFNEYHSTISRLFDEIGSFQQSTRESVSVVDKQEKSNESEKMEKLFHYLLIFIAVIVVAFVLIILVMKMQKNKKSINLQKQLQRKAQMELNKQKFQATQQKNKFKI